jgi:CheY-like chemotaxis protein
MWSRKPVVLIADDNIGVREIMRLLLEMKGCLVLEAADGVEAVEAARATVPDMALIDIHMPVMDGLEVARRLRRQHSLQHVPIVAITASDDRCLEAIAAGCNECCTKPLLLDGIENLFTKYLGHLDNARLVA